MIESISIRNLGVISSAQLNLSAGFTALTGETGAGKTMVLTALNLLLGGRADSGSVRNGESSLFAEGRWFGVDSSLSEQLIDLGADLSEGELIVNRTVSQDGRSKAAISGASVPISVLSLIADQLVTVHGQSDQLRLRSAGAQREALDAFGGAELAKALSTYSGNYLSHRALAAQLKRIRGSSAEEQVALSKLRELIFDIEALDPFLGELEELSEKVERLGNVESLREAADKSHDALSSETSSDVMSLAASARKALELSSDPILLALSERLKEIGMLAGEVAADLSSYLSDLDADPSLLQKLLSRRAELISLERKHGRSCDELVESLPALRLQMLNLDSSDEQLENLEKQLAAELSALTEAALGLTKARISASERLSHLVSVELSQLAMGGSALVISVGELAEFEATGKDSIEFLLASHLGAQPRPLAKGASGGELSRIMLAIELVLAESNTLPTMVFDEVDAGVGGQAAVELGRRLKKLSETTQVIVVTHLAQVAAFADHQLLVSKNSSGEFTATSVSELFGHDREVELARMLSGSPDSAVAIQHARELLQTS
ncbi:DNA repair protein RecN [Candidatus Aquiluna sp. UB-MaderosW2red]|uniref:DNA repair protein RecN n=1 Tax=Candidatus Aquiluna sp. UB-MaderosW2red TaxID=1855377 RepID=UPI000875BFD0|nr:DNA repair protein RecN [Candidatus Aquiluna sp. UB-MaderosW2red]SCX13005.1 DNA repair protein RecN (Recombination protein N) [Candidatus Aquiluna sp. UB-MaderosW2red]